jgi:PAT family beta-lactamase induction signal transducer AmpG
MRVIRIRYGELKSGVIEVDLVQDVFSLSSSIFGAPNGSGYVDPNQSASPLGNFIRDNFGEKIEIAEVNSYTGAAKLVEVRLSKAPAPGEKMILNTRLDKGDKSLFLPYGERLEFTENNWDKPAYILIQADSKLDHKATAQFEGISGNISFAWSVTFFILAGFFVAVIFSEFKSLTIWQKQTLVSFVQSGI